MASIRRIVLASRAFLTEPPKGLSAIIRCSAKRGMITVARTDQLELLREDLQAAQALVPSIVAMTPAEAIARVPVLRKDYLAGAYIEPHSMDIDVNGLHQGFCAARVHVARESSTKAGVRPSAGRAVNGAWRPKQGHFLRR